MPEKQMFFIRRIVLALSLITFLPYSTLRAKESATLLSESRSSLETRPEQQSGADDGVPLAEQVTDKPAASRDKLLVAKGRASYYATRFHGKKTANGEHFNKGEYTAAHRSLPFGTLVRVTNLSNGRHVFVRVNDRGPHLKGRIIDLSLAAAREIGLTGIGVGNVQIEAWN